MVYLTKVNLIKLILLTCIYKDQKKPTEVGCIKFKNLEGV